MLSTVDPCRSLCLPLASYSFIPTVVFVNACLDVGCYAIILLLWGMTAVSDRSLTGASRLTGIRNANPLQFHVPTPLRHRRHDPRKSQPTSLARSYSALTMSPSSMEQKRADRHGDGAGILIGERTRSHQSLLAGRTASSPQSPTKYRSPKKVYPMEV